MSRNPAEYRKALVRAARRFTRAAKHAALFNPRHLYVPAAPTTARRVRA